MAATATHAAGEPVSTQAWARALDQGLAELARWYPRAEADLVDLPRRPGDPIRVHLRLPDPAEAGWASVDAEHGSTGALQPDSRDARTRLLEATL